MKIPPGIQVIKCLTKHYSWTVHRRDGSHITLKKEGEINIITVPMHDRLKVGTFLAILRKAKVEKEDFLKKL